MEVWVIEVADQDIIQIRHTREAAQSCLDTALYGIPHCKVYCWEMCSGEKLK